jgi:hypothetical protein
MRTVSLFLVVALAASPALAGDEPSSSPSTSRHRTLFWSGLALGIAGVTMSVVGVTAARVEDSSSGNAPIGAYRACVAQQADPIYATNNCDALKGKNRPLLWSGVAVGAVGAVLLIGSTQTSAQISSGSFKLLHTIRF